MDVLIGLSLLRLLLRRFVLLLLVEKLKNIGANM
jgi:hypothetical protein